jgi:hypothetical protein
VPDWVVDLIRQPNRDQPGKVTKLPVLIGPSDDRYRIDVIVRNELARVASSVEGTRNETLNQAAYTIGGLLHTRVLDEAQARHQLYLAAVACGLVESDGDSAVWATIESGLAAGQNQPFTPAEDGQDQPFTPVEQSVAQPQAHGFRLKWHGEQQEPIPWLVKGILPRGGVGLIAGQSTVGKSFIALDLAGAVATGMPFLDRRVPDVGGTLFLLGEAEGTMPERLEALCQGKLSALQVAKLPIAWTAIEDLSSAESAVVALANGASNKMQQDFGVPLRLVIVDTIATAFAGRW